MKTKLYGLGLLSISAALSAAPHDPFLQTQNFNQKNNATLHLTAALDAVNDTIDIFDLREAEGVSDKSAGDYQGLHLIAQYDLNPTWSIEGAYWYREIEYTQDTNDLHSALIGVRYRPQFQLKKYDDLVFRGSLWANRTDRLSKTTPTLVNARTFQQVNVSKPEDLQLQLDAIFSRRLDPMNQLNAFASVGYSKVDVNGLDIQASYRGCLMDIAINSANQYTGNLAKPCKVDNALIEAMSIAGDANEFGLNVDQDLNYDSYYMSLGGSWNWRYDQFESQLAYQYQRLWRNDIDDRVNRFGNSALKDNHTIAAKFSYDFNPHITGFLSGEIYQNNFVGYIPFLYNGVTASRLDKRYGLASLGVTLHHF